MKKPCGAIANNSGSQCKNIALKGHRYCWIHYPKKDVIEFFVLGLILQTIISCAIDNFTISNEEKLLNSLTNDVEMYQTENLRLKNELNNQSLKTFNIMGRSSGGIEIYSHPASISLHYREAEDFYDNHKLMEAKETLELILRVAPHDSKSLNLLGIVLNELGNTDVAIKILNRAYEISNDPEILENIKVIKKYPGIRWEKLKYNMESTPSLD